MLVLVPGALSSGQLGGAGGGSVRMCQPSRKVLGKKTGEPEKLSGLELERVGIRAGHPGWSMLSWSSGAMLNTCILVCQSPGTQRGF